MQMMYLAQKRVQTVTCKGWTVGLGQRAARGANSKFDNRALPTEHRTMHNADYTMHNAQCTMRATHCTLLNNVHKIFQSAVFTGVHLCLDQPHISNKQVAE